MAASEQVWCSNSAKRGDWNSVLAVFDRKLCQRQDDLQVVSDLVVRDLGGHPQPRVERLDFGLPLPQGLLRHDAFVNVGGRSDPLENRAMLVLQRDRANQEPAIDAIVAADTDLDRIRLAVRALPGRSQARQVVGMVKHVLRNMRGLIYRQSSVFGPPPVDEDSLAFRAAGPHQIRHGLAESAIEPLAVLLGGFALAQSLFPFARELLMRSAKLGQGNDLAPNGLKSAYLFSGKFARYAVRNAERTDCDVFAGNKRHDRDGAEGEFGRFGGFAGKKEARNDVRHDQRPAGFLSQRIEHIRDGKL